MNYNILVIDDDPLVLSDTRLMYEEMIEFGDLEDIFTGDAQGTIATAANTKEAEKILAENFTEDPKLVQILHVDQRMPGETGSEFVDRMRWVYAGRRIGALLVTGYSADASVQNSREAGVYRFIPKPITAQLIKPHLDDLVKVIFSKEKPVKKKIDKTFIFKEIKDIDSLIDYFKLRYNVFSFMNYMDQRNDLGLDIDNYDPYSYHFAIFEKNGPSEKIVATIRIVTSEVQPMSKRFIDQILERNNPSILGTKQSDLKSYVNAEKSTPFPTAEAINLSDTLKEFTSSGIKYGEFSRIIDHPDYRGYGLSALTILSAIAFALNKGITIVYGQCDLRHEKMYEKYGWKRIPDIKTYLEEKVQCVAIGMVQNIKTELPEVITKKVTHFSKINSDGYNCICPLSDCYTDYNGYGYDLTSQCPIKT